MGVGTMFWVLGFFSFLLLLFFFRCLALNIDFAHFLLFFVILILFLLHLSSCSLEFCFVPEEVPSFRTPGVGPVTVMALTFALWL